MRPIAVLLFVGCVLCSASAETQFNAYMVAKDQPLLIIRVDDSTSDWLPLAGEFHGCRISAFDPKAETLTVKEARSVHVLALKSAKVSAGPIDPDASLRMLKGLPLAYEVARRGDEDTRAILIRYQQTLAAPSGEKANQDALQFLRTMLDRVAAKAAQRMLAQPSYQSPDTTPRSVKTPAV